MQCVELQLRAWVPCLVPAQRLCWEADATLPLICKILWEVADASGQDFLPGLRAWGPVTHHYGGPFLTASFLSGSHHLVRCWGKEEERTQELGCPNCIP